MIEQPTYQALLEAAETLAAEIERLERERNHLQQKVWRYREALAEAMNWNWLDDDMPQDVIDRLGPLLNGEQSDE